MQQRKSETLHYGADPYRDQLGTQFWEEAWDTMQGMLQSYTP